MPFAKLPGYSSRHAGDHRARDVFRDSIRRPARPPTTSAIDLELAFAREGRPDEGLPARGQREAGDVKFDPQADVDRGRDGKERIASCPPARASACSPISSRTSPCRRKPRPTCIGREARRLRGDGTQAESRRSMRAARRTAARATCSSVFDGRVGAADAGGRRSRSARSSGDKRPGVDVEDRVDEGEGQDARRSSWSRPGPRPGFDADNSRSAPRRTSSRSTCPGTRTATARRSGSRPASSRRG